LLSSGKDILSSNREKLFNQFQEKFHHDYDETVVPEFPSRCINILENILTTEITVLKRILDLAVSKSCGDDGIANKMLKLIANPLAHPLTSPPTELPF
jgi:hypothetical protein